MTASTPRAGNFEEVRRQRNSIRLVRTDACAGVGPLALQVVVGTVDPPVAETFPPSAAGEAQKKLNAGGVRGRLVILFSGNQ
jgi:hypothetical protein